MADTVDQAGAGLSDAHQSVLGMVRTTVWCTPYAEPDWSFVTRSGWEAMPADCR